MHTRRSRLETYEDILEVLVKRGALKTTHIMHYVNVNFKVLEEYIGFLIKQGLVEERIVEKGRIVYAVTSRGVAVLKSINELEQVIPKLRASREVGERPKQNGLQHLPDNAQWFAK